MNEDYLHAIWRMKRLPFSEFYLTDGRKLTVKNTGWHNPDSGPDFFNGSIEIEGITWNGNIEFHVKSSDWYLHKHHLDQAYNNVILHVVLQHDKEVLILEQIIPTLELKNYIDFNHWKKYKNLLNSQSWIPCENSIQKVDSFVLFSQIEVALINRLKRKYKILSLNYERVQRNLIQFYLEIYASSFGVKVNEIPFIELCQHFDVKLLWKEAPKFHEILILGIAGFFQEVERFSLQDKVKDWIYLKKKYNLKEMQFHTWKFKGLRPPFFPHHKLIEFSRLSSSQQFFQIQTLSKNEIYTLVDSLKFSSIFRKNILINAIIPILWWNYEMYGNENLKTTVFEILEECSPEKNSIITKWEKLGVKCKSSFETQGLLELKNELCTNKKCLTCKIGYSLLKK